MLGRGDPDAPELSLLLKVAQDHQRGGVLIPGPRPGVELDDVDRLGAQVAKAARKAGILMRPLGDVMVFMPPLSITASEIDLLLDATLEAINDVTGAASQA